MHGPNGSLDQYRDKSRSRVKHGSKGGQDRYRDRSRSRVKHGSKGSQDWYRDRSRSYVTHENRNREDSPLGSEIGSQQINSERIPVKTSNKGKKCKKWTALIAIANHAVIATIVLTHPSKKLVCCQVRLNFYLLFLSVFWIRFRTEQHKEMSPGSGYAWTDVVPDPGGKKAWEMYRFIRLTLIQVAKCPKVPSCFKK